MKVLSVRNRQKAHRVNLALLRKLLRALVEKELGRGSYEIGFHLVGDAEMVLVNENFLQHAGSTDVITFDHAGAAGPAAGAGGPDLAGEIFICLDEAVAQSRRYRTSWQSELVRYAVHGLLHLEGYDDQHAVERRRMKAEENRLLRRLGKHFAFDQLAGKVTKK